MADAVDQALLNPEVNEALATFLTDQVMDAVPLEDLIAERVPEELEPFIPVLVGGVRNVVHEGITRVLEDGRAREALVAVGRARPRGGDAGARGRRAPRRRSRVEGEDIKVNLLPLLSRGLERLQDRGILTSVDLPELTADGDPEEQIAELEDAIDRDLPDDFGQLVVYSSENVADSQAAVARAQDAFALFRRSIIALVVLTVVCARRQRRPGDQPATRRHRPAPERGGGPRSSVASSCARSWRRRPSLAAKPGGRAALEEMVTSLTDGLLRLVSVGLAHRRLALALVAFLLGNERAMTRLRGAASRRGGRPERGRRAPRRHGAGVGRAGAARHHAHRVLVALAARDRGAARRRRRGRPGRLDQPAARRPTASGTPRPSRRTDDGRARGAGAAEPSGRRLSASRRASAPPAVARRPRRRG